MLSTVTKISSHLEVKVRMSSQWEKAILQGYRAYREVRKRRDVILSVDMNAAKLVVER